MRNTLNFNSHWQFTKPGAAPVAVTLPHTWNAADGTDGGNDYFRGICTYTKEFAAPAHADDEEVWLEFEGAAMTAVVTLNDQELTRHAGGYSTFRVNLTPALAAQNTLTVTVDNSANRTVYPQKADFVSLLITEGSGALHCGGEQVTFRKGDSLFLPAGSGAYAMQGAYQALKTTV